MTTKEKAKAYDEALSKARMYRDSAKSVEDYAAVARYENIFTELCESEDEKIRKGLIFFLKEEIPQCSIKEHANKLKEFVAWLEKQEEQSIGNNIIKSFVDSMSPDESLTGIEHDLALYAQTLAHYKAVKSDVQYNNALKGFAITVKESLNEKREQKPVEWSEEDEKMRYFVTEAVQSRYSDIELAKYLDPKIINEKKQLKQKLFDWLRDLRPHWKPSEEQVTYLLHAEGALRAHNHTDIAKHIAELYEQLKKLI